MSLEILPELDTRIPRWSLHVLQERPCPLCHRERLPVFVRPDRLPVAFCEACSFWYVCRLPAQSELSALYDDYWRHTRPSNLDETAARSLIQSAHANRQSDLRLLRLKALLGGLAGKRILDVGCGRGEFLLSLQAEGAEAIGIDLSHDACRFVARMGIEVHHGQLGACDLPLLAMDAIVMSDLIEHAVDPMELLAAAYRLLKPGGLLLLWTPNGGSAGCTPESARAWTGFRVDLEHLQYFSPGTVVALMHRQGWILEHLEALGQPDLDGIKRLAGTAPSALAPAWRLWASRVPGLRAAARFARRAFRRRLDACQAVDPRYLRDGSYHLFSILRRPTGEGEGNDRHDGSFAALMPSAVHRAPAGQSHNSGWK